MINYLHFFPPLKKLRCHEKTCDQSICELQTIKIWLVFVSGWVIRRWATLLNLYTYVGAFVGWILPDQSLSNSSPFSYGDLIIRPRYNPWAHDSGSVPDHLQIKCIHPFPLCRKYPLPSRGRLLKTYKVWPISFSNWAGKLVLCAAYSINIEPKWAKSTSSWAGFVRLLLT